MWLQRPVGLLALSTIIGMACASGDAPPEAIPELPGLVAVVEPSPADQESISSARQAADGLGRELMGLLLATMEREGPGGAIVFCADSAQARSAALSTVAIQVRRVSMRPRNLANAPDALEEELLDAFAMQHAEGRLPPDTTVWIGAAADRELRYLRPIIVQQRCLACHGDPASFEPAVRELLANRYPDDRATGYVEGDLRGAISVRLAAPVP